MVRGLAPAPYPQPPRLHALRPPDRAAFRARRGGLETGARVRPARHPLSALIRIRAARERDARDMAALLNEIISVGGTTAHTRPFGRDRLLGTFISAPRVISCLVACDGKAVLGFQALEWADPDCPGEHRLPPDWAIISTYVRRTCHGKGMGAALFEPTRAAARKAGVAFIDATIRRENAGGLAFYGRLGFEDYRQDALTISKRLAPK